MADGFGGRVNIQRTVSSVCITLSKTPLDAKNPGYQAPLSAAEFAAAQEGALIPQTLFPRTFLYINLSIEGV